MMHMRLKDTKTILSLKSLGSILKVSKETTSVPFLSTQCMIL
ncbi:hypothetical protein HanPSC8_Chr14g0629001 [Helianthus annuus]|nr:hypothetical protein HanPSC8_Chr14g0629001 [Helianthus annuus]